MQGRARWRVCMCLLLMVRAQSLPDDLKRLMAGKGGGKAILAGMASGLGRSRSFAGAVGVAGSSGGGSGAGGGGLPNVSSMGGLRAPLLHSARPMASEDGMV